MQAPLNDVCLDRIFRSARTHNAFTGASVTDEQLRAVYDLMKFGPTSTKETCRIE